MKKLSTAQVLACGAAIVMLSTGIRHGFGLWLQPLTQAKGWSRESFSFAMASQNLIWGLAGVLAGMAADRIGAFKVLAACGLFYALGLLGMAYADSPTVFALTGGLLIGLAQAGTTYAVIFGVIGRNVPAAQRAWAMGVAATAGSFGQFLMVPVDSWLIARYGWQSSLVLLGLGTLLILPLAWGLREPGFHGGAVPVREQTVREALGEALRHRSFQWLLAGYFVCGFQVVFIGVHMPAYLKDQGLPAELASQTLAVIGLFNVFGTYLAGLLGQRLPKHRLLVAIYLARSVAIALFLLAPLSSFSVYLFSAAIGLLWLSTVPLTNAIVAQIFGVAHLSMLGGLVFFSHQVGSFLGVWLGGVLYDRTGHYDIVWGLAIALGVFAALANLRVNESSIHRRAHGAASPATA